MSRPNGKRPPEDADGRDERRHAAGDARDWRRKSWLENVPAYRVLTEAIRAVPPVRYALGVAGVVAVLGIVAALGVDLRVAAFGTSILLVLMVVLVVFGHVASAARARLAFPAVLLRLADEVDYLKNEAEPLVQIAEALEEAGDSQALPSLKAGLKAMEAREAAPELIQRMQDAVNSLAARQRTRTVGAE